jgi:hypothetical protein
VISSLTTGLWHYLAGRNVILLSELLGGVAAGLLIIGLIAREFLVQRSPEESRRRLTGLDAALLVTLVVVGLTIFDRFYVIR